MQTNRFLILQIGFWLLQGLLLIFDLAYNALTLQLLQLPFTLKGSYVVNHSLSMNQ